MIKIVRYEKLTSTNKFSLENIDNIEANSVIRADLQENGRGRFDRKWISDKRDNCYISFVLKPDLKYQNNFPNLTQYLSIKLCEELENYNISPNIKWPNDVLINGKKISGILSEVSTVNGGIKGIVLGIGVNLNLTNNDLNSIGIPATSLNLEANKKIDSDLFIENLADRFFGDYESFLENGFISYKNKYLSYCDFLGKKIQIKNPNPTELGIATNICDNGALEIETENGEKKIIFSGDVVFLRK